MSDIVAFNLVRALDGNGNPVPGARARFFRTNTTTPATVYSDVAEQTPHPVPLVADANGIFPPVFRSGQALRVVVTDPSGTTLPGFPLDPVISVSAGGTGASQISFAPTGDIAATNVQAAIETVQANLVAPLLAGGLGVTGDAPLLADIDATNIASGFARWNDTTSGTLPAGWDTESGTTWFIRENVTNGVQFIARRDDDALYYRPLEDGSYGAWSRYDLRTLPDQDWIDGTSISFASPSPAQIKQAIEENAPADFEDTAGAVGTYAFAWLDSTSTPPQFGDTVAGSDLRPAGFTANNGVSVASNRTSFNEDVSIYGSSGTDASTFSGTWRCMGEARQSSSSNGNYPHTLWLRIV